MNSPLNDEDSTLEDILNQTVGLEVVGTRTSWVAVSKEWEGRTPRVCVGGVGMMAWLKGSLWVGRDNGSLGVGWPGWREVGGALKTKRE